MPRVCSIDPGVKVAGVAIFEDDVLVRAQLVRGRSWEETAFAIGAIFRPVDILVAERPQIYVQSRLKGDPNDLVTLSLMVGATTAWFSGAKTVLYLPREWKKQIPKDVMIERVKERLSDDEWLTIDSSSVRSKSVAHNTFDAIGIGLFHLGRLQRPAASAAARKTPGDRRRRA